MAGLAAGFPFCDGMLPFRRSAGPSPAGVFLEAEVPLQRAGPGGAVHLHVGIDEVVERLAAVVGAETQVAPGGEVDPVGWLDAPACPRLRGMSRNPRLVTDAPNFLCAISRNPQIE